MAAISKLITSLTLTVALGASTAACSSSPVENVAEACDSYEALVGAVAEVKTAIGSGSTIGEIREARDEVKTAYADLEGSLEDVSGDRLESFEEAWKDLDHAVSELDENLTVPQARDALSEDFEDLETAHAALSEDLSC